MNNNSRFMVGVIGMTAVLLLTSDSLLRRGKQ